MAEAWYAIKILHMEAQFGIVLICATLPRILFMLIGGVIADNFHKAHVVSLSFVLRSGLLLLLAILIPMGYASFTMILVVAFLYGMIDAFYLPSREAFLNEVIEEEHFPQAISILILTSQICTVASPAIAGILLTHVTFPKLFLSIAGLLLISAGSVYTLVRIRPVITQKLRPKMRENFIFLMQELKEGWSYIRHHPQFSVLMPLFAVANLLFMGPLQQSVPLLASRDLAGSASAYGNMWSFFTAGSMLGGVWLSFRPCRNRKFLFITYALLAEGALLACLALTNNIVTGVSFMFMLGLCVALNNLPAAIMLQTHSDKERIGRVIGFNDTLTMGLTPLSYLIVSGLLMAGVNHKFILASSGILMFMFCLMMMRQFPIIRAAD
jgi:DHA3 family macrolide efflux protein-like MFS transporter